MSTQRSVSSYNVALTGAACIILLFTATAVRAHPGQSISLEIDVDDEAVTFEMLISADFLSALTAAYGQSLPMPPYANRNYQYADPQRRTAAREAIENLLLDKNPVTINGEPTRAVLQKFHFIAPQMPGYPIDIEHMPPDLRIKVRHPAPEIPEQVAIVWELFPQDASRLAFGMDPWAEVVAQFDAYAENKIIVFTKSEPEYIWHQPPASIAESVSPVIATPPQRAALPIPLVSAGLVSGWLIIVLALGGSPAWPRLRRRMLLLTILPLVGATLARDIAVTRVPLPFDSAIALPDPNEAVTIFSALHRNVYQAFEKKTESDIYDVLAYSVGDDLLDRVYNEIYQSLILRDQGGAVARIKGVEILDAEFKQAGVIKDANHAAYQVDCRWRVHGAVYHWGHVHSRTNEYTATYTVAQRDNNWKIVGVNNATQERIIMPGDDPEVPPRTPGGGMP